MPARRPRGFTLVEVLIAVALTAILVTLLFSALGTYLRASHAVTGVVEREDRYYAAAFFLRRQLRELLPFS
ncbi:MAG: PulJ/GspJ family protein, partial [Gammaproteobacteria bacterium]